jgi:hypothetical protein
MVSRMPTLAAAVLVITAGSGPCGALIGDALVSPLDPASPVGDTVREGGIEGDVRRWSAFMAAAPSRFALRATSVPVRMAFLRPFALPELARAVASSAGDAADRPFLAAARHAARAFGVNWAPPPQRSILEVSEPQRAIFALDFLLNPTNLWVRQALDAAGVPADPVPWSRALLDATPSTAGDRAPSPAARQAAAALPAIDRELLVRAVAHFDEELAFMGDWSAFAPEELPPELAGAVDGAILTAQPVPELGWLVVGGLGPNRYDMSRIAAVFEPGGDDRYEWPSDAVGSRLVVDVAGDDAHATAATGAALAGAAGAAGGVCVIDDRAGNDRYACGRNGLGGAVLGVAMLLDRAGNDSYEGGTWTIASAIGGIGAVMDQSGDDSYASDLHSQASAGPVGAALLVDCAGNDRYRADGTAPSAYGTAAVSASFSQACGYGFRSLGAPGGVATLVDLAGDDRYECGEFGQGCGYFLGLGTLHDHAGSDLFRGNRYAQGTAAHQAFGALLDDRGDDVYWSMTAAGQGAAWDMAAAVLVDRAGDDTYRADGLSQGAAAQQALGMLVDLGGADAYRATGRSQGEADDNRYHWDSGQCTSFGILVDRMGPNRFTTGKRDGERRVTGEGGRDNGNSRWGVFVTR